MRYTKCEPNGEKILAENYPARFLKQLGATLGKPVGIKDTNCDWGCSAWYLKCTVGTSNETLGKYIVRGDRTDGEIRGFYYEGEHPLAEKGYEKSVMLVQNNGSKIRRDPNTRIEFPGIPIEEKKNVLRSIISYVRELVSSRDF